MEIGHALSGNMKATKVSENYVTLDENANAIVVCKNDVMALAEHFSADGQERIKELEAALESMTHAAKELHGTVLEYCDMPCKSLERRMFQTASRYKNRIFNPKIWVGKQK